MNDILLSVLLPTRKRTQLVEKTVRTLLELADNPKRLEVLIAYDNDDAQSADYFKSNCWRDLISSYNCTSQEFCVESWGYYDLNKYYNYLSNNSKGCWYLIWNDDALMLTDGWDSVVEKYKDYIGMLSIETTNNPHCLFPIVPKLWKDLFGTLCDDHNAIDSWIYHICKIANCVKEVEIKTFHDRFSETGNNNDEVFHNRKYRKKEYKSKRLTTIRNTWADILIKRKLEI